MTTQQQLTAMLERAGGELTPTMGETPLFHPQAQAFSLDPSMGNPSPAAAVLVRHSGVAPDGSIRHMSLVTTLDAVIFTEDVHSSLAHLGLSGSTFASQGQALMRDPQTEDAQAFIAAAVDHMLTFVPDAKLAFLAQLRAAGVELPVAGT